MLVYEYMPNGTLRDHLSANSKDPLSLPMRLKDLCIYTQIEADPPIFHRDVKGYLDPEYFLTHKSDVYSLGVVFLELVTGKPPIFHGENIIRQVNVARQSGEIFSIVDKRVGFYSPEYVEKILTLALKCCKDAPDERPKMTEVARELEIILSMMPPEYDDKGAEYANSDSGTIFSSQPSGSDLVSGDIPIIRPR